MLTRCSLAPLVLVVAAAAGPAYAGTVTIPGSEFDVIYDPSQLGLFNAPQLVGNVLFFTPNSFSDQSLNGQGLVTNSSLASGLELVAHPGFEFANLSVAAQGDYVMMGASSSVNVTGSLMAVNPTQPLTQTTVALQLDPGLPMNLNDGSAHNWSDSSSIDGATPTDTPGYNPWLPDAGTVDLSLQNTLYANTAPGSGPQQAFIQEKFAGLQLYIDPISVPLPESAQLLLTALALLGASCAVASGRSGQSRC